eukprot:s201_g5.t1
MPTETALMVLSQTFRTSSAPEVSPNVIVGAGLGREKSLKSLHGKMEDRKVVLPIESSQKTQSNKINKLNDLPIPTGCEHLGSSNAFGRWRNTARRTEGVTQLHLEVVTARNKAGPVTPADEPQQRSTGGDHQFPDSNLSLCKISRNCD